LRAGRGSGHGFRSIFLPLNSWSPPDRWSEGLSRNRQPLCNPKASALYQCVENHFAEFETIYAERYQEQYGFYRSVIGRVVAKFLGCGDLTKGFARIRCDTCRHEYLLAFVLERSGNPAGAGQGEILLPVLPSEAGPPVRRLGG
jgi:hypothetical protein